MEVMNYISETGQTAVMLQADLTKSSEVRVQFDKVFREFGIPSVLVNNSGFYPPKKSLIELDEDLWQQTIDINLKSQYITSKIFAEQAHKHSRIINLASLGAFRIWDGRIPYHASKAGVIHQTRAMAFDLAPNISVNSISPGIIVVPENEPDIPKPKPETIPMGRYGDIDDLFSAVYFFATCSHYITVQNIAVDGGQQYV
jgi:NAD(P)-dependent dehydrogenase (short-subunit alcohol dehydrogenase family)